jgi:hypothetical protein
LSFLRSAAGPSVQASLGRLEPNGTADVKILGRASSPGVVTNAAGVSGGGENPALLANNDASTDSHVTPTEFQPPADVPPPVFNQSVDVGPVRGTVRFRRPGSNVWETLTAGEQVPVGTEFDTTNGAMLLTTADETGAVQTAEFYDGFFTVGQVVGPARKLAGVSKAHKIAITQLVLTRGNFSACASRRLYGRRPPKGKKGSATARKLWGRGKGSFRTKGKYSAATVRGTWWLTADRCDGTLTQVREGVVAVNDFAKRGTVIVRAGGSYLAKPRR